MATSRGTTLGIALAAAALACSGGKSSDACRLASAAGAGPGDASNHFPLTVGSRWYYDATETSGGTTVARYRTRVEITGTRDLGGATASVFSEAPLDASRPPAEALFAKGPSGVTQYAGPGLEAPLDRLYPNKLIPFPLAAASSFEQVACSGVDYGSDLDGDGKNERVDVRSSVSVVGEEAVATQAGTFTATRVDTHVVLTMHGTRGATASIEGTESVWYAPGIGVVSSASTIGDGQTSTAEVQVLVGFDVEGRRGGVTNVARLASTEGPASSDTETPGRPALSFDGSGHLIVWKNGSTAYAQDSLGAAVIDSHGATLASFGPAARHGYGFRPAAAFNGTNHLVVSNVCTNDAKGCSTLFGQRVTPAGALLDGATGFDIASGGATVYPPAVASDGDAWLVAWSTYLDGLRVAPVSGSGTVGGTALLRPPGTTTSFPAVAFGGGAYLVAWAEGTSVVAVRVRPDGSTIDAAPFTISSSPGDKSMGGVAFDGTRFLVVWGDSRLGDTWINGYAQHVYAARVATDGTLVDGPPSIGGLLVNAYPGTSQLDPLVAFDGSRFVVTWWLDGFQGDAAGAFAALVTGDGTVHGSVPTSPGMPIARSTASGGRLVHPVAAPAPEAQTIVAWIGNSEVIGTAKSIQGAWYAW